MGEESDLGYHYPYSVVEPSELEIKVLNKKYVIANRKNNYVFGTCNHLWELISILQAHIGKECFL